MRRHIAIGFAASVLLFSLYFGAIALAQGLGHALEQTRQLAPWLFGLVAGFGIQAGLFSFIRGGRQKAPTVSVAASGGVSAGSMVACCAHHLSDVLPLLGLSGAALFLADYQLFFIVLGLVSNGIGILIMLDVIQRNGLWPWLGRLRWSLRDMKRAAFFGALPLLALAFLLSSCSSQSAASSLTPTPAGGLQTQKNEQGGVTFEVQPFVEAGKEIAFSIVMDTHSVALDYDMVAVSSLEDDRGNRYAPLRWEGMGPGGHHRSGTLFFPSMNEGISSFELTIADGVPTRAFRWQIR